MRVAGESGQRETCEYSEGEESEEESDEASQQDGEEVKVREGLGALGAAGGKISFGNASIVESSAGMTKKQTKLKVIQQETKNILKPQNIDLLKAMEEKTASIKNALLQRDKVNLGEANKKDAPKKEDEKAAEEEEEEEKYYEETIEFQPIEVENMGHTLMSKPNVILACKFERSGYSVVKKHYAEVSVRLWPH